jgi:hypothetical protein
MALSSTAREAIYLRDRTTLTGPQRRRLRKHVLRESAVITPQLRRQAHRDVTRGDRLRRINIRAMFAATRARRRA